LIGYTEEGINFIEEFLEVDNKISEGISDLKNFKFDKIG
jgi:hypothetical protein